MIVVTKKDKECNIMKNCNTFHSYNNGKLYSACIECVNKKVRCEFGNKELNNSYLRSHVKKQHIKNQHYNQNDKRTGVFAASRTASHKDEALEYSQLRLINKTGGDLLPAQLPPN